MSEWVMAVTGSTDPSVDRAAFDDWYDTVHLPEVASCPGFRRGTRYETPEDVEHGFLTLYDVDGPEALESEEFLRRRGWGPFTGRVSFTTRVLRRRTALIRPDGA
jgi:hypothetical protein